MAELFTWFLRNLLSRAVLLVVVSILAHAIVHLAPGEAAEVDPSKQ